MQQEEENTYNDLSDTIWNTYNLIDRLKGIRNDAKKQLSKEKRSEQTLYDISEYIDLVITKITNRIYGEKIMDIRWFERLKIAARDLVIIQNKIKAILPKETIEKNIDTKEFYAEVNDKLLNLDKPISNPNTQQYRDFISFIKAKIEDSKPIKKKDEEEPWFKAGSLIADGTIHQLREIKGLSFSKICIELGLDINSWRPYISAPYNNNKDSKNFYNNENKYLTLYNYCKEKDIKMDSTFLAKGKKFCP